MQTISTLKLAGPKLDCGHQSNYDVTKVAIIKMQLFIV